MAVYNQQTIKSVNKKNIYRLINEEPGISRICLASITNLSKTTVSALVEELIQEGYITDKGTIESNKQGRKPNSLVVNSQGNNLIVVNWRKHYFEIALVNSAFSVKLCKEVKIDDTEHYAEKISELVKEFIKNKCMEQRILGICLIVPGMIDSEQEEIISMVLKVDKTQDVIRELRRQITNYPIAVFNDTACFAYAENAFGEMKGENYVYLNMNEGVGAALVYEGNILKGATGMGTQFGHFSVDRDGETCVCGNRGCLENRIGELALAKIAEECNASEHFIELPRILFKDVANLAGEGNIDVLHMIDVLSSDLSYALANLIAMFHPEKVIIGGVGRKLGEIFLNKVQQSVKQNGFKQFVENVEISYTKLSEDALLQGAAKYYMDMHYEFLEDMTNKLFLY